MFIQLYNLFIVNKVLIIHFNKTTRTKKSKHDLFAQKCCPYSINY